MNRRSKVKGQRVNRTRWVGFALLPFTFYLAACSKAPPTTAPSRPADSLQQLASDITALTRTPGVRRGAWGVVVQSLDRNERLFAMNPGTLLVPASTAKLMSLAAAVQAVGWDHRFETTLSATGPIAGGVLQGDLIVAGSGDPSIGGRGGADLASFTDALRQAGLTRIEGRIVADDDAVEEPRPKLAWAWDDLAYATGALFGALNFGENRMDVVVSPGGGDGLAAELLQPYAWGRPLRNRVVTGADGSRQLLWPEQRPGEPVSIAGSIPAGAPATRISISVGNPTLWFANALRRALIDAGVNVTGDAHDIDDVALQPQRTGTLYTYRSPTLAEIALPMLKDSINLYGEAALRLSTPAGAFPTNDAALEGLRQTLDRWGIPPDSWQIVDGSGLSRRNAVAPEALVAILQRMYDPAGLSPWMTALPVAGRDGTLATRMRGTPAEGNVRAKTGTMSNIRALAGYVRTKDGETLAFAILADNFEGSGAAATETIDRIAVRLAGFTRR